LRGETDPYLVYAYCLDDNLGDFKRSNGFQRFGLRRYFVSLTAKGRVALKLGLHRGWKEVVPKQIRNPLKKLRTRWYDLRSALPMNAPRGDGETMMMFYDSRGKL
jgi:hypothetical protein